jgi:hypothetical protein
VDDLAARRAEIEQARASYQHRDRVRAAARYAHFTLPDDVALAGISTAFDQARHSLAHLDELIGNEARLLSELLEPAEEAIQSYIVRYLQLFDDVTARAEQARQEIEAIPARPAYRVLGRLAEVEQLGADPQPQLNGMLCAVLDEPARLFPTTLTRAEVERRLRQWPQPPGCFLTLENAGEWRQRVDEALAGCQDALQAALLDKAGLLQSEALRRRLAQGCHEPFIAGLLAAPSPEDLADYLVQALGGETTAEPNPVDLLCRYLKELRVSKLRLTDFAPSRHTIEPADVDGVVAEFRAFLLDALNAGEDELPVIELET